MPRPAAFLDRDGVINLDVGYPHRPDELAFTPTAAAAIARLNAAGYLVIVVTNQSGVARGYFTLADIDRFHAEIQRRLAPKAHIDAFYVAPWHPEGTVEAYARDHPDRKPGPGLILRAMAEWTVDRARSFLIGDKESDIVAARLAGVRGVRVARDTCDLDRTVAECMATTVGAPPV